MCDDSFSEVDASVVCIQLGYSPSGATVISGARVYGEGTGIIWLDEVHCQGFELHLSYCGHRGWGIQDCSHSEDVGVECTDISADTRDTANTRDTATNVIIIIATVVPVTVIAIIVVVIVGCRRHKSRRSRSNVPVRYSGGSQPTVQIGVRSRSEESSARYRRLSQTEAEEVTGDAQPPDVTETREPQFPIPYGASYISSQSVNYVLGSNGEAMRPPLQPTSSDLLPPFTPFNPQ